MDYQTQYTNILKGVKKSIEKGSNIIICGPARSGKTYLKNELSHLLDDYNKYYGIEDYNFSNQSNGRTFVLSKLWIETNSKEDVINIMEDYDFFETTITYPLE